MQKSNWLVMQPLNKIQYDIALADGTKKTGYLRFTRYQQQQHEEISKNKEADIIEVASIIFNPVPNVCEFTKEQIEEALDLDEIRLLVNVWLQKKVINPSLTPKQDPDFF